MSLSIMYGNHPHYGSLEPIPEEEEQTKQQVDVVLSSSSPTKASSYKNVKSLDDSSSVSWSILASRRLCTVFKLVAFVGIAGYFVYNSHGTDDRYKDGGGLIRNNLPIMSKKNPKAYYYHGQSLDHFDSTNEITWSHPFFVSEKYFKGPGHPLLVIVGGAADNILYPFVSEGLAKEFGGMVLQTEHRFYGESQPVGEDPTNEQLNDYLSPEQAMADAVEIIQHVQAKAQCAIDRSSPDYCPVITIGASHYLGFLSALMRLYYPNVVDIAYASSAPLLMDHEGGVNTNAYLEKVSKVADKAVPGCSKATHDTLQQLNDWVLNARQSGNLDKIARRLGICPNGIPLDITSREILNEELVMIVAAKYAQSNQNYYPPSENSDLVKTCQIFKQSEATTAHERYATFLKSSREADEQCFNANSVLADGRHTALFDVDWHGEDGRRIWEFQQCRDWMIPVGSSTSMFYQQKAWNSSSWIEHCQEQFGVTPTPRLQNLWNELHANSNFAKKLLFTNGMNDGWSAASKLYNGTDDEGVITLNFPNGAHHSELQSEWPLSYDTADISKGFEQITTILQTWISQKTNRD
eukprot:CAMPEP_0194232832 /NCGR_PEP_ID=MMETSP0158-20130606/1045_1 /TAXON_ID=33649 /ORGANISM="Thalassionema nitzschioides, Strain L26-B" /LENGTH=578 /DNA_ID=CAMNT_0038965647 /DNA_START=8 /DNA_END=1744 /DNA_ORIENTATION=+